MAPRCDVVRKIWDGLRNVSGKQLWYGLPIGAAFTCRGCAATGANGVTTGSPFIVPAEWVAFFVAAGPQGHRASNYR